MRDGDPAQYWYARTILVSNDEGVVRYVLLAASSPSITGNGHFFERRLAVALGEGRLACRVEEVYTEEECHEREEGKEL